MVLNKNVMSLKNNELYSFLFEHNQCPYWTWSLLPPLQWIITFCKCILAESPHPILSSVFISPYFLCCSLKRAHFFLSCALPTITSGRAQLHLQDTESLVPKAKSNLNYALKLSWIKSWFALCPIILLTSLFFQFLIIWLGFSLKPYPVLSWLVESFNLTPITNFGCSLFLPSLAKTNVLVCFTPPEPNSSWFPFHRLCLKSF